MNETAGRSKLGMIGASLLGKSKIMFESLLSIVGRNHLGVRFYDSLMFFLVAVLALVWAMRILPDGMLADEGYHWSQIVTFLNGGQYSTAISPLPGYHLTMTYLIKMLSLGESLLAARCLNWFLALSSLGFFFWMIRRSDEGNPYALSFQMYLSPIIFPFFFLIYTDLTSLSLVLLSLLLTLEGRYRLAATVAGISLFFRQTNIMWLFLFWMLALSDTGFFNSLRNIKGFGDFKLREFAGPLYKTYIFPILCMVFVGFVVINKGVAMGEADVHTFKLVYPTQIFMLLCALFFLFIPMHVKNAPAIWRLLKSQPLLPFLGAFLYAVYMITFDATHDYNYNSFYLRNWLLNWLRDDALNQSLLFMPMLWAFYSLLLTPFREKKYYWFYPVTILYLLPIGLIEPRYFIVPVVLFTLFRKPMDDRLEYLTAAIYIPVAMFIFMGTAVENFFL